MKSLGTALLFRIGARGVSAILQAATLILIARQLGPSEFGIFGQAQSLGIIGAAVLSFGFAARALRLGVEPEPNRIVSGMFVIRVVTASIVTLLVVGIFFVLSPANLPALLAAGSFLFADMLNDLTQGVLSGLERQKLASALFIVHRLLPFLGVVLYPVPGLGILGQFTAGCLLSALVAMLYPAARWARPGNLRTLTAGSSGFWLQTMAGPISQLDTTIIRLTAGVTAVGYYAAAARVGAPLNLITSSVVNIAVPAMTKEKEHSARLGMFIKLRRIGTILALFIIGCSPIVAELAVRLLGEQYRPGWPIFCGIVIGAAFSGISQMYQAYFFAVNRPHLAAASIGIGTVTGLCVLAVAILLWGIPGLALGPIALQLTILLLFAFFFTKIRRERRRDVPL